jgi:predicted AlkP superfamily pyrophosphatase or phosphodiesterase
MMRWLAIWFAGLLATAPAAAQTPTRTPMPATPSKPLVILVSIDGFRADYLDRGQTPNLLALARDGVRSAGMRPSFPSITFPNHYTLVTGLYPDHHGIVGNSMVDPSIQPDSRFTLGDFTAVSDRRWWDEGAPIWVTAKRAGLVTATMFWPGSEAAIQGVRPDLWAHFDGSLTPDDRVDIVLDWLSLPAAKRPNFVTLYFDEVDHEGHAHGPDSEEVNRAAAQVDAAIGRLREGLASRGLLQDANLVIVADHGMAAVPPDHRIYLDDYIAPAEVSVVTAGAVAELAPAPGADTRRLMAARDHMRCSPKGELPARFHYGANPRIPPVVCVAQVGWIITTREAAARHPETGVIGEHGYDNAAPEMAALFVAHGPAFRRGMVAPPFDNVDVEPLLAHLLRVASPPVDGSLAPVGAMLQPSDPAGGGPR